jgi:signal transduction histidine kinase
MSFLLTLASASLVSSWAAEPLPRAVLILDQIDAASPWYAAFFSAFESTMTSQSASRITFYTEHLDLNRFQGAQYDEVLRAYLRGKYRGTPIGVLVAQGSSSLEFAWRSRAELWPEVPLIFAAVDEETAARLNLPSNVTGTIYQVPFRNMVSAARALVPGLKRIVVVGDAWEKQAVRKYYQPEIRTFADQIELIDLIGLPMTEVRDRVAALLEDTVIICTSLTDDGAGARFSPYEGLALLAEVANRPIVVDVETNIGHGATGGFVATPVPIGQATGQLALRILNGEDASKIPAIRGEFTRPVFDWRLLERFGINKSQLPPESEIRFRPTSIWEEHRNLVLATLFVFALQTIFLGALLFQRRRKLHVEALLKTSEERMTFAAASANIGLWQFNRKTNELWATEHCRGLFSLTNDVPLTRDTFLAAVHPEDREIAISALRDSPSGKSTAVRDVRVVLPDDQVHWVRIRASNDQDVQNQLSGIFVDITEQKAAENEALMQRQEVAHLMRVSVLGELSGAIAHEINQPLTAILSNAQAALHLLEVESPDLAEVREAIDDIVHEDNRAGEVIARLRNLLRKGEKKTESVDLNDLVHSTIALLKNELIGRHINTETALANGLPEICGDPVQLQQVLLNLFMNAMDAMATTPMGRRHIMVSTRRAQGSVEVLIRDYGSGLGHEDPALLFKPFHTSKTNGLGLGLTICSTIAEAHGGKLTLSNHQDGGTVAGFWLPAREHFLAAQ